MGAFVQALLIGLLGAALFLSVEKYEPDSSIAYMLKFLLVLWGSAAILHKTHLLGYGFF